MKEKQKDRMKSTTLNFSFAVKCKTQMEGNSKKLMRVEDRSCVGKMPEGVSVSG